MKKILLLLGVALLLPGCYHATIETGRSPSPQTIEQKWAKGWIYGLVPPETVTTMERCSNGVARVETQLSFANQLVSFLTFGIFTPMEIVVTCASGGMEDAAVVDSPADFDRALKAGAPFLVAVR